MVLSRTPVFKIPSLAHLAVENLYLKIADNENEIIAAQALRYETFYKELGAKPVGDMERLQRDFDDYDPVSQHLLVIDRSDPGNEIVVGTYRLLMLDDALRNNMKLYTETEFDISKLKATKARILETNRSCVAKTHRTKIVINLLWKGLAQCVFTNQIDYLIGVPSFHGVGATQFQSALAYLNAYHLAPEDIRPRTIAGAYHPFPHVPKEQIDARREFVNLPPLLKGYLRAGVTVGDGYYIDHRFNLTDICIILSIANVTDSYFNHYKRHDVEA